MNPLNPQYPALHSKLLQAQKDVSLCQKILVSLNASNSTLTQSHSAIIRQKTNLPKTTHGGTIIQINSFEGQCATTLTGVYDTAKTDIDKNIKFEAVLLLDLKAQIRKVQDTIQTLETRISALQTQINNLQ